MFLSVISACLFPKKKGRSFRMTNVLNENTRLLENGLKNKMETCEKNIVGYCEIFIKLTQISIKKTHQIMMSESPTMFCNN